MRYIRYVTQSCGDQVKLFIESIPKRSRMPNNAQNVYLRRDPLALEQRVLADAGRQIEAIAFAVARHVPSRKIAELMEIAAKIQSFRLDPPDDRPIPHAGLAARRQSPKTPA